MRFSVGIWTAMLVGLLGGALLLSGCGQKVAAPLPFQVTTPTTTTVITRVSLNGTVLDQKTGIPVAGARVTLGTIAQTTTGADGSYTFTGLLPGTYYISVSKAGYIAAGSGVVVSTEDVFGANLFLTAYEFIPNVEEVRGTETVQVSEEGVTETKTTVVSLKPPEGQTSEDMLEQAAAGLVVDAGVTIKDAAGNVITEPPALSVTYLEPSQTPTPASGTFGMKPEDVYTRPGTKETATTEVVVEGETVELTVETPNELLAEGARVRATKVPFAGFVLEANGEQGGTFSEPQTLTVNPQQLTVPVDLLGSGIPVGTQIPFVDSDGEVTYGTLQEDGTIDLEVTKIDTYLMQTDFNIDVIDSKVTASLGAAKPVAPQAVIRGFTEFLFAEEIDETTKAQIIVLILTYMNLAEYMEQQVILDENQQVVEVRTETNIIIEVVLGEYTLKTYRVTIISINGVIQEIRIVVVVHESGGGG